jgi:hypothetical protein
LRDYAAQYSAGLKRVASSLGGLPRPKAIPGTSLGKIGGSNLGVADAAGARPRPAADLLTRDTLGFLVSRKPDAGALSYGAAPRGAAFFMAAVSAYIGKIATVRFLLNIGYKWEGDESVMAISLESLNESRI